METGAWTDPNLAYRLSHLVSAMRRAKAHVHRSAPRRFPWVKDARRYPSGCGLSCVKMPRRIDDGE
jgi:hypothetical protein